MDKVPTVANDNSENIELEFDCSRLEFAQNAELICEVTPDDASIYLFECAGCGKSHLRITLPPLYTRKFTDRLGSALTNILYRCPAPKVGYR
jgi:hypothetical protein